MAEQLGVECGDDVCGPADAFALRGEAPADDIDEIGDVGVDRLLGARRVIRRLLVRRHVATRHASGLHAGVVVVGVEVAVCGVPRVAGLRRPHAVADLQVAAERDDVGPPTGLPSAVSPCSDGPSTMKWPIPAAA